MNRETKQTGTPGRSANTAFRNPAISPMAQPPIGVSSSLERGESASTVNSQTPTDSKMTIANRTALNRGLTRQSHNSSQSTVSVPAPQCSIFDLTTICNHSSGYHVKLVTALERGKIDVNTFVLQLQEVNDCQNSPLRRLRMSYNPTSIRCAVIAMINETILYFIQKRDAMRVDNERSRKIWIKYNTVIAELDMKRDSM